MPVAPTQPQAVTTKMSPDTAKCPWGVRGHLQLETTRTNLSDNGRETYFEWELLVGLNYVFEWGEEYFNSSRSKYFNSYRNKYAIIKM